MQLSIRKAQIQDMPRVLELIQELADYENELPEVEITLENLENDGFSQTPLFTCFVAEENKTIHGMALVYTRYSTWKRIVLHLEDLIVSKQARGKGIGGKLLDRVILYGLELGVKRIGWDVLDWNESAIKFYEKKGARIMRDWDVVQLNEQGIKNYISLIN